MYFEAFSSPYSSNKTLTFYLINDALFVILLQELFSVFINSDWGIVVGKSLFSLDNILILTLSWWQTLAIVCRERQIGTIELFTILLFRRYKVCFVFSKNVICTCLSLKLKNLQLIIIFANMICKSCSHTLIPFA